MKPTSRRTGIIVGLAIGSIGLLVGCQNEVPQKDMPGGIRAGTEYQRLQAQQRATMSPAMQDAIVKSRSKQAAPTTRPTTAPVPATAP